MTSINNQVELPFDLDKAWIAVSDFGRFYESYDPVTLMRKNAPEEEDEDAYRSEIIQWEEKRRFVIDFFPRNSFVFKKVRHEYVLEGRENHTQLNFHYTYDLKLGFMGKFMNSLFMKSICTGLCAKFIEFTRCLLARCY